MTRSASPSLLGPEFDDFLFAPIGEERNGMLLSVVSALARLDVDPWQETAQLAQLRGATAAQRLASLIAALPDRPSAHQDPRTIAARLIELLPRRTDSNAMSRPRSRRIGAAINSQSVKYTIVINVIFVAFVVATLGILAIRQPAPPVDNAHVGSSQVIPQMLAPNSGK
jgi:hypothetical protein